VTPLDASKRAMETLPEVEANEVRQVFESYSLSAAESAPVVEALRRRHSAWIDFMMRFELGLEQPDPRRALSSAVTIGGAYVAGGFVPLTPYIVAGRVGTALLWSVAVTLASLAAFGSVKARFTGCPRLCRLVAAYVGATSPILGPPRSAGRGEYDPVDQGETWA